MFVERHEHEAATRGESTRAGEEILGDEIDVDGDRCATDRGNPPGGLDELSLPDSHVKIDLYDAGADVLGAL